MSQSEHRPGISEASLVVRHLKLEAIDSDILMAAVIEIDQIKGMDNVSFDEISNVLNLAYDASQTCIDCIEEILTKHEIEVSHDWWTRFKEGYFRFVDENIKDNAKHTVKSCHKPPPSNHG